MKYLTISLSILVLVAACSPGGGDDMIPADLEGKKEFLKQKRTELLALNKLIASLEDSIALQDPDFRQANKLVTTLDVKTSDFRHYIEVQGSVEADDLVDATSETSGRIISMSLKEGDLVKKGQLVAKIDMEQVSKQIAELETSMDLAKTVYERQKRLWDQNIGTEIQYLEAKNNKERLEKNLETIRYQLEKAEVYAPLSGVVEKVVLQSGEFAAPGTPILQILNTNKLKVEASVPENYLSSIKLGQDLIVHIPALDEEIKGKISLIGSVIDPANRTFTIEVNLPNTKGPIKPNLLATVKFVDFFEKDAVSIPLELVQQEVGGKDYVFVVEEGPKSKVAKKVYVKTGNSYQGNIVISEGLKGGETLIVEGARGLTDNTPVEIVESNPIGATE